MNKYEDFMVRRVLLGDPDSRWCPAPDCSYAVIATGCASCPRLRCERPGCDVNFCYHCKAEWHPDQTCDAARASRHSPTRAPSGSISQDSQHRDDIKPCPRCQVLIVKMDDGSCNHMVCAVCGSEFCWLCMKEISDLHYLSPSGCTFWGKKPWSRKKKLLWQLGTLVGAPVGIALVAGIAVPAMIIGIPVWVGRKIHTRYKNAGKHKRNCAVLGGVAASVIVSPVLAGLAVAIGVPILLFYVYGVVPVSLCRAGCGVSTSRDGVKFDFDEEVGGFRNQDTASADAVSRIGATSIGEVSLSVASGSHIGVSTHNSSLGGVLPFSSSARESTTALAGSITGHRLEVQADVSTSETASAVTCVSEKSGNTLNDTASTRALAGSILSYKQQMNDSSYEDGASERVRFDNTICYVYDCKRDPEMLYTTQLDQDSSAAEKASLGSGRSFRSSERSFRDDNDSTSLSSLSHKRISLVHQRLPTKLNNSLHRNLSTDSCNNDCSTNIPENINLEMQEEASEEEEEEAAATADKIPKSIIATPGPGLSPVVTAAPSTGFLSRNCDSDKYTTPIVANISCSPSSVLSNRNSNSVVSIITSSNESSPKFIFNNNNNINSSGNSNGSNCSMSKTTILRNLFFFQNENGSNGGESSSSSS